MKSEVTLDAANRIVLSKSIREAAGIGRGESLTVSVMPGVIVLGRQPFPTKIVKKGKFKLLSAPDAPKVDSVEAVKASRR